MPGNILVSRSSPAPPLQRRSPAVTSCQLKNHDQQNVRRVRQTSLDHEHFYWQATGGWNGMAWHGLDGMESTEADEIIFIDRYKQAAADIDSRPVGSHISEASFGTSLEAIKRRTHFLRSCCHLVVAGHPR